MKTNYSLFIFLSFIFLVLSCRKEKSPTYDDVLQLSEYVSAYSQNLTRHKSPVEIKLSKAIEDYPTGEPLPSDLLKISPSVDGELVLSDPFTLIFAPSSGFKGNKNYTFTLRLQKLFPDEKMKNKNFKFSVFVAPLTYSVMIDDLRDSPGQEGQYIIKGHVNLSDVVSAEEIKSLLKAKQKGRSLDINFYQTDDSDYYDYTIHGVKRGENPSDVALSWNGDAIGARGSGKDLIAIPPLQDNSIVSLTTRSDPDQVFLVNFSEALDPNQNLSGLIEIDSDVKNLKASIDGNTLLIYPPHRLSGEQVIHLYNGIRFLNGSVFAGATETLMIESLSPAVRAVQNGHILPYSDEVNFRFQAVALRAIDVRIIKIFQNNVASFMMEHDYGAHSGGNLKYFGRPVATQTIVLPSDSYQEWKTYSIDLQPLIQEDPGAIYQVQLAFRPEYGVTDCQDETVEIHPAMNLVSEPNADETYWDNENDYYDSYWDWVKYDYRERDNPCDPAYYNEDRFLKQNILSTDLGLIAKQSEKGEITIFASDLVTAKPLPGVEVRFFTLQNQLVHTQETNQNGRVTYTGSAKIKFVEAVSGNHPAYLDLKDYNALQTSQFEVEGTTISRGLKGYIYADRGVWRPGDTLHVCFVLNDTENPLPPDHPVSYKLTDPQGTVVDEQISHTSSDGFYCFQSSTPSKALTGKYLAHIQVGGATFAKSLSVETIKPNRLKIDLDVAQNNQVYLQAKWLHGASAPGLHSTVDFTLNKTETTFPKFSDYVFDDPANDFYAEQTRIFDGDLDDTGQATFTNNVLGEIDAPGKLRATYITQVYERGGNSSIDAYSTDYSPYESYVGIKTPKTKNYYRQLDTDKDHKIEIATVDADGNGMAVADLEVKVYLVNFRWWWNRSDTDLASYVSSHANDEIYSTTLQTNSNGKGSFSFRVDYPQWGSYLIRVYNPVSGHYSGKEIYIDWPSWRGRSDKGGDAANILAFTTNKTDYEVGDNMEISFPSSPGGRALLTIENSSKVLQSLWVEPKKDFTKLEVPVTKDMTPNAYVSIHYIQLLPKKADLRQI